VSVHVRLQVDGDESGVSRPRNGLYSFWVGGYSAVVEPVLW